MALTDLITVKAFLNITDASQDAWLTRLAAHASDVVLKYCKRALETAIYTDYLSGNGLQMLPCRQRPVTLQTYTGTLNATAVVTGLSPATTLTSTGGLWVNSSVAGTGIPAGTNILTVDSSTQVTLSNKATVSGSQTLTFGPAVQLDPAGFAGRGNNAFSAASVLREGFDWLLDYGPDGNTQSKSGNLIRLGGGISGTTLDAIWPWEWRKGTLTVRLPPVWPGGLKNVKVTYQAGFGTGPANTGGTLPEDLTEATNMLVAFLKRMARRGGPAASESLGGYSYSLMALRDSPELGEARQVLGRYRELVI